MVLDIYINNMEINKIIKAKIIKISPLGFEIIYNNIIGLLIIAKKKHLYNVGDIINCIIIRIDKKYITFDALLI